jgi:hypothetical protein
MTTQRNNDPDVQTVTYLDTEVMQLAIDAIELGNHSEARRILEDRLEWYVDLGDAIRARRHRNVPTSRVAR